MAQYNHNIKGRANTHGRGGKVEGEFEYNTQGLVLDEIITQVETTRVVEQRQLPAQKGDPVKEYVIIREVRQGKPEKKQVDEATEFIQHVHATVSSEPGATFAPFRRYQPAIPGGGDAAASYNGPGGTGNRPVPVSSTTNSASAPGVIPYGGWNNHPRPVQWSQPDGVTNTNEDRRTGGENKPNGGGGNSYDNHATVSSEPGATFAPFRRYQSAIPGGGHAAASYNGPGGTGNRPVPVPGPVSSTTNSASAPGVIPYGGWNNHPRPVQWSQPDGVTNTNEDRRTGGENKPNGGGGNSYDNLYSGGANPTSGTPTENPFIGWSKTNREYSSDNKPSIGWAQPISENNSNNSLTSWAKPNSGTAHDDQAGGWPKTYSVDAPGGRAKLISDESTNVDSRSGWAAPTSDSHSGGLTRPTRDRPRVWPNTTWRPDIGNPSGGGWTKPTRDDEISTTDRRRAYEKPTQKIEPAPRTLSPSRTRPAAPAWNRYPQGTITNPTKNTGPAVETIDSEEAARRYNGVEIAAPPAATQIIDSREAAKRYRGKLIPN